MTRCHHFMRNTTEHNSAVVQLINSEMNIKLHSSMEVLLVDSMECLKYISRMFTAQRTNVTGHAPRANVKSAHLKFQGQSAFVPVQFGSYCAMKLLMLAPKCSALH